MWSLQSSCAALTLPRAALSLGGRKYHALSNVQVVAGNYYRPIYSSLVDQREFELRRWRDQRQGREAPTGRRRYEGIARRYSDDPFCASVLKQLARGRPVTKKQAAVLMRIEAERQGPRSS